MSKPITLNLAPNDRLKRQLKLLSIALDKPIGKLVEEALMHYVQGQSIVIEKILHD